MKTILTVALNYFPGYMSGGVARTILNTTHWLGEDFKFLVVTRDRDLKAAAPYPDITPGAWHPMGPADVRYLAPHELSLRRLAEFLNSTHYHALHLNSYFDPVFTIRILLLLRLGRIRKTPVLVSPRGEFGAGSLCLKYPKKKAYIECARLLRLYDGVTWHASSRYEADEIAAVLRIPVDSISIAIDLPVKQAPATPPGDGCGDAQDGLRAVFLSRVSREKNLDGALRILQDVQPEVSFDMIGPLEDPEYWSECEALIKDLPANVQATYRGPVSPEKVPETLSCYDLLLFPSHGENYGHAIAESISVGTRVLISRFTPWRELDRDGLGWDFDLADRRRFVDVIERVAGESPDQRRAARERARSSALTRLFDPAALQANRSLLARLTS